LEKQRWKLLSELFSEYLQTLCTADLADPYHARRQAVESLSCVSSQTIVLVGTTDLNRSLIEMLRGLNQGERVGATPSTIAYVAAPASYAERFDEFGSVRTEQWLEHELPWEDRQLIPATDVADQALGVTQQLADYAERFSADLVTVGVTDESLVAPVEWQLRGCGVKTYRHLGWAVSETSIGRLFHLITGYLQRRSWQTLAALVRHADVHAMISANVSSPDAKTDWLTQFDQLLSTHFPIRVRDPLPPQAIQDFPLAAQAAQIVETWLAPLLVSTPLTDGAPAVKSSRGESAVRHPLANWSRAILACLDAIYPPQTENENDALEATSASSAVELSRTTMALDATRRLLARFHSLNPHLDVPVSGSGAVEMLAARLGELRVSERAKPEEVEILGWLDLALDDAPAMVIVGLNHPFVPEAVTSDPFLPGSMRTRLRMSDNQRRYARDVYSLQVILSSRAAIRLIVGKTSADGSPTPPSRLLAAAAPVDTARRIRNLFDVPRADVHVQHRWDAGPSETQLPIPHLPMADPLTAGDRVTTMSVTAFAAYLACPYRFYLRHILKLRPLEDASSELAANQFGDLIHGALESFGESKAKDETHCDKIEAAMVACLHDYARRHYGEACSMAVKLQVIQAERRLKIVAQRQAERIADGWYIRKSEASVSEQQTTESDAASVWVDGKPMGLRGRFDRIDYHPQTDRWAILDYKTHGHPPEQKHLKKQGDEYHWVDLQLPLYRLMIPFLRIDADPADVQLGYFNISEKDEETKINLANFDAAQLEQAEQLIHDCIRNIWAGKFEPTEERVLYDDYSMILQTGVTQFLLDRASREPETEVFS